MDELKGWSFEMFQMMCILRGCDYLANIKGVGFKRALEFVKQNKTMKEIIEAVKRKYKDKVPVDYEENFEKAFLTFVYQRVYDPKLEKMCLLNVPKDKTMEKFLKDVGFIGKMEDSQMMKKIANGEINPKTKEPLKSFQPISAESGAQEELKDDQEEEENLISLYNRLEITMKADEADSNEE
jgi:exonuclease-1